MSVRLIIVLWLCSPIAIALVLLALKGRTLFGDRADDLSSEGADEGGRVFHDQPNSNRERNKDV